MTSKRDTSLGARSRTRAEEDLNTLVSLQRPEAPSASRDRDAWLVTLAERVPDLALRLAPDGRVLFMNASARSAFDSELEVGPATWRELVEAASAATDLAGVREAEISLGNRCFRLTATAVRDETDIYLRDITDLRRAEAKLESRQESYRSLMERLPVAVVVYDNRCVVFANAAALRLFAAPGPEAFVGADLFDLVHVIPEPVHPTHEFVPSDGQTAWRQVELLRLDGRRVCCKASETDVEYRGEAAMQVVILPVDPPAPASDHERPSRRVLIIEHDADAADSLRQALELKGHQVAVAHTGPDGIAKAHEFHPDLALCDIGLPGMDGYAVARAFHEDESLKQVRLVALSACALPADSLRSSEAGFERHLARPSLDNLESILGGVPIQ